MRSNPTLWGLHMSEKVQDEPITEGYVGIGFVELGDFQQIAPNREAFKNAIAENMSHVTAGAIPVHAGTTFKFIHEMEVGDLVVYPSKHDRMINVGEVTGDYRSTADADAEYPNRRSVKWLSHRPRSDFSQTALNEIGSAVTLFQVRRHRGEFLTKSGLGELADTAMTVVRSDDDSEDDDLATRTASLVAEETTEDFIIRRLMSNLDGYEFEEFVAHILECMGYTARVTPRSGDGGVDVIAHKDSLGFEPPILKVQCKRTVSKHSVGEVNQLLGTLGEGEFGLFVSLGSFSTSASHLERNRSKLRLIDGEDFVDMILSSYGKISPKYRSLIPLRSIFVPDIA